MPDYISPVALEPRLDPDDPLTRIGGAYGWATAISGDGLTIAVGAPGNLLVNTGNFVAVWAWNGSSWQQQQIIDQGLGNGDQFGTSLALSADGNTLIIGSPNYGRLETTGPGGDTHINAGAAWVYVRTDGVWTLEAVLLGERGIPDSRFGYSVALSADGNTALIGDPDRTRDVLTWGSFATDGDPPLLRYDLVTAATRAGSAFVFVRDDGFWSQEAELHPEQTDEGPFIGYSEHEHLDHTTAITEQFRGSSSGNSVALSADGNIAVASAPTNVHAVNPLTLDPGSHFNSENGSIYSYYRESGVWTDKSRRIEDYGHYDITDTSAVQPSMFAQQDIEISPDGTRLLVSGFRYDIGGAGFSTIGNVWLYKVFSDGFIDDDAFVSLYAIQETGTRPSVSFAWADDIHHFGVGTPEAFWVDGAQIDMPPGEVGSGDQGQDGFGWRIALPYDALHLVAGSPLTDDIDGSLGLAWVYRTPGLTVSFDGIEYAG